MQQWHRLIFSTAVLTELIFGTTPWATLLIDERSADRSFDSLIWLSVATLVACVALSTLVSVSMRLSWCCWLDSNKASNFLSMDSLALGLKNFFAAGKHSLQHQSIDWIPSIALMFCSLRSEHFWWNQRSQAVHSMALVPVVTMLLHRPQASYCWSVDETVRSFLFLGGILPKTCDCCSKVMKPQNLLTHTKARAWADLPS